MDTPACQFAVLPVLAMPDLPRVNVEMHVMPHPDRAREMLTTLAGRVQSQIGVVTDANVAMRTATLVPEGYLALK